MSEREEYLQDIAKSRAELEKAKKEVETLKAKVKPEMAYFKTLLNRASSYMDPDSLNDIKDIYRTISALQDIHSEENYDKLMANLNEIDDLIRERSAHGHPGKIQMLEEEIEEYESEIRHIDNAPKRKSLAAQLDEIASDLESQGEPVLACALDKVSDFLDAKYVKKVLVDQKAGM